MDEFESLKSLVDPPPVVAVARLAEDGDPAELLLCRRANEMEMRSMTFRMTSCSFSRPNLFCSQHNGTFVRRGDSHKNVRDGEVLLSNIDQQTQD